VGQNNVFTTYTSHFQNKDHKMRGSFEARKIFLLKDMGVTRKD
jgi:hypothetical protein